MSVAGQNTDRKTETVTVYAGCGAGFNLARGDEIIVINESGTQVVDFWCISSDAEGEYLSMEHCREVLRKIWYDPGDVLISNRYTPMIEYVADSSGGKHDTLIAACSTEMYRRFGHGDNHASCASNFHSALVATGSELADVPQPWNLFMRAMVQEGGLIDFVRPPYVPNGFVHLKLLTDARVIVSACPDDVYPTNGGDGKPEDVAIVLRRQGT